MTIGPPPSPGPRLTSASYAPAGLLRGCCFPPPSLSASPAAPASPTGTSSFLPQPRLPRLEKPPSSPRWLAQARPPPTVPLNRKTLTAAQSHSRLSLLRPLPPNSCHSSCSLVSISGPSTAQNLPFPVSGPPSHFRGTLCRLHAPTCTSGPPLSLFLDALQAPKTTSGPLPPPAGLPPRPARPTQVPPRAFLIAGGQSGRGGGPSAPPHTPSQSAPAPEAAGLARAPHPSASGWSFRGPAAGGGGKSGREPRRHDDTSGLLGTFQLRLPRPPHRLPPLPQGPIPPLRTASQLPS